MIITVYRVDYYNADASTLPIMVEISDCESSHRDCRLRYAGFNKSLTKFDNLTTAHQDSI